MSSLEKVPTLDLNRYNSDKDNFVKDVFESFSVLGFCCFSNHGIPDDLLNRSYKILESFFALPSEIKKKYHLSHLSGKRGYIPFKVETAIGHNLPDLKEFWHTGREKIDTKYSKYMSENIWPENHEGYENFDANEFKRVNLELYETLESIGHKILKPLALAIDLPEDYFNKATIHGNSILRALHYPPINPTDLPCIRAQAHEDAGLITILIAANGSGLEVKNKRGEWIPVIPKNEAIIVNVGDMMQRLTNHVYTSTTHRVVNPEGDLAKKSRYSIPFFMDPNPDFLIETLPTCITKDNPNLYPEPILANDFLIKRLSDINVL